MNKKKLKKKVKSYKSQLRELSQREMEIVFLCLGVLAAFKESPDGDDDPELFGAYSFAMAVLSAMGIVSELEIDLDIEFGNE